METNIDSDAGNSSEDNGYGSCNLKSGILDGEISDSISYENEDTRSELNFDECKFLFVCDVFLMFIALCCSSRNRK